MKYFLCALALSLGVAYAENVTPNMLNQTHDGASIQGGTYFNTAGSETKFINSAGTGITLDPGKTVRGVEAANGMYTGNGGAIHIQAPDQVVRLNGNIDVRGFLPNGSTGSIGDGGKVTIDASYLFQNGNIYAGGFNGGNVQFNVGGMTMASGSRIDASGNGVTYFNDDPNYPYPHPVNFGLGGKVTINSTGDVTISKDALIKTHGAYFSTAPDLSQPSSLTPNISIVGRAVNMDGVLYAADTTKSSDGHISLVSTGIDGDINIGKDAILQSGGGVITVDSQRDINQDGAILNTGGTRFVAFDPNVDNMTLGSVWGANGGKVNLIALGAIKNSGRIQADGGTSIDGAPFGMDLLDRTTMPYTLIKAPGFSGGDGGTIVLNAPNIENTGVIRAIGSSIAPSQDPGVRVSSAGGSGGSVNFSSNPTGDGVVAVFQGAGANTDTLKMFSSVFPQFESIKPGTLGTITAPDPVNSTNQLFGVWKKAP